VVVGDWHEWVNLTKIVESDVAGISVGNDHSVYWKTNGDVYVFGSNLLGQLGNGRALRSSEKRVLYDPN
tara:strand:- start:277 stop:483 length:207 start_codon:yes stop_codon:yes gene_type:complete